MGHHHHHHVETPPQNGSNRDLQRYAVTKKVTLVGALVNIVLSVVKILFGYIGQSQALIADGVHSLSDLATDALVIIAAKHSSKDADDEHPYGHGRIETLMTVVLGIFLILVACGIMVDSARRILEPDLLWHPGWLALWIGVLSILAKEALYHYTVRAANKVRSKILHANAWHHRSDAISSILVVVGIGGTLMGFEYLDAVASVALGLFVLKIGWDLSLQGTRELVDTALEPELVESINEAILKVDGVRELHSLRTRRMGGDALVDVHILVDPKLSVSEGHFIGEAVHGQLLQQIEDVTDVMVHIDPEDDEKVAPSRGLPSRSRVRKLLQQSWQKTGINQKIDNLTLHYLDGKIHVEVSLPLDVADSSEQAQALAEELKALALEQEFIAEVSVLFH